MFQEIFQHKLDITNEHFPPSIEILGCLEAHKFSLRFFSHIFCLSFLIRELGNVNIHTAHARFEFKIYCIYVVSFLSDSGIVSFIIFHDSPSILLNHFPQQLYDDASLNYRAYD